MATLLLAGCAQTQLGLNVIAQPGTIALHPSLQTTSGNFTLSLGG